MSTTGSRGDEIEIVGPAASVLHGGRRFMVTGPGLTIGRAADNDVVLDDARASRRHAQIRRVEDGGYVVEDLESRHGTLVNGKAVGGEPCPLSNGDQVVIGDASLRFLAGEETRMASRQLAVLETQTVRFDGRRMTIGRDESNDVVLADPNVSRFHAELVAADGAIEVVDLGSRNGTRLNGEPVQRGRLEAGAEIGIGPFGLKFDGTSVIARDEFGALRLEVREASVAIKGRQILKPTSLTIESGELVAIIGESGAGKSTLLKAISGVSGTAGGQITINGAPLAGRLTDIGYVPQDDIVHRLLTVTEALSYAARLRLPEDASGGEIDEAVARAMRELALEHHAQQRIGSLSGGQRKRTGVATELLGRPGLLFLDEPTTGMDPGLESKMMSLFRELANESRAVVLVTHATKNLALCDRVVVLGRGGVLAFEGSPAEALQFFGTENYDGIYDALDTTPAEEWQTRFKQRRTGAGEPAAPAPTAEPPPKRPGGGLLAQTGTLTGRYVKLMSRDKRNLALLLGQAPLLGLAGVGLFRSGIFNHVGGNAGDAIQLLFLMSITTIWLGSIDSAREIIKERSVFERESAVGLRLSAYLLSKLVVLFALVVLQVVLNAGVLLIFRPLHESLSVYAEVFLILVATGFAAVAMGLLISTVASSEDQSMSLLPLALIPQLLFAGTIVPLARMAQPAKTIAYFIFEQWSLAGLGTVVGMNDRLAGDAEFSRVNPYGTHFFDVALVPALLIQVGFFAVFMLAVVLVLRRRRRSPAR
jgi:ABC-type multidrug transport system ATPase subunit/ABC-type multidrug transport system permease subunit